MTILNLLLVLNLLAWPALAQVNFMLLEAPVQADQVAFSLSRDGDDMGCLLDGSVYWWTVEGGFRFLDSGSPRVGQVGMAGGGQAMVAAKQVGDGISATIWSLNEAARIINPPTSDCPGNPSICLGLDLSDDGSVVVGSATSCGTDHGFAWNKNTGIAMLDGSDESETYGLAVSADGAKVVGYSENQQTNNPCPTIWFGGTSPKYPLGTAAIGKAQNISLNGRFIVGSTSKGYPADRGFIWTEVEGARILDSLKGKQADPCRVTGVSNGGVVVGCSGDELFGEQQAFIWDKVSGIRVLGDVLRKKGGRIPKGHILQAALDISGDGNTIVGLGRDQNYRRTIWLVQLDNPEVLGSSLDLPPAQVKASQPVSRDSLGLNQADMLLPFPYGKRARQHFPVPR